MRAKPFLELNYEDLKWHHVGPLHERACFNHVDLIGYAATRHDVPPFHIYNVYGWRGPTMEENIIQTIPAAKRAGRAWIKNWLGECEGKIPEFEACETGVHFVGRLNGMQIANYYFCEKATAEWHKGFRVWFGNTYYETEFATPDDAKEAIAETWKVWLSAARSKIIRLSNLEESA